MSSSLPPGLPPIPKSLHAMAIPNGRLLGVVDSPSSSASRDSLGRLHKSAGAVKRPNLVVQNGQIQLTEHGNGRADNIEAAMAFLRNEMVALRQMDSVLLSQLCHLNDAIQEVKLHLDPDTTSTSSSRSLDHITESEEYESYTSTPTRIYENTPRSSRPQKGRTWSLRDEDEYLEPQDWRGSTGGFGALSSSPRWNPPPSLSLEILSLPPPPPLPLSSPPRSPPIPTSPIHIPGNKERRASSGSTGSRSSGRRRSGSRSSQGSAGDGRKKWPGYLLNSSTSYESAC